jgi:hypothetical protein
MRQGVPLPGIVAAADADFGRITDQNLVTLHKFGLVSVVLS